MAEPQEPQQQLRLDLEELTHLRGLAKRPRVISVLSSEIRSIDDQLSRAAPAAAQQAPALTRTALAASSPSAASVLNYVTLGSFSWDQDNDKLKIYVSLEGVEQEKVDAVFKTMSVDVKFHDVQGKNYRCAIPKLNKEIVPEKCKVVVKPLRVIITLHKASKGNWLDLHFKEDKAMSGRRGRGRGKRPVEESSSEGQPVEPRGEPTLEFMRSMERFLDTFQCMPQAIQQQVQQQGELQMARMRAAEELARCQGIQLIEKFKRLNPPVYKGESRPDVVEGWIREMEKIFVVVQCSESEKVNLATYMLQDRADEWWQSAKGNIFGGREEIKWQDFLAEFNKKFFSEHMRDKLEMEFLQLQQGYLSVSQYEIKFSELIKYSPYYSNDEKKKTRKFVQGLRGPIKDRVSLFDHASMAEAFRVACIAEENLESMMKNFRDSKGKEPAGRPTKIPRRAPVKPEAARKNPLIVELLVCKFCNNRHAGQCWKYSQKYFRCGSSEYFIKDCPKRVGGADGRAPARVYHISREEDASEGVENEAEAKSGEGQRPNGWNHGPHEEHV